MKRVLFSVFGLMIYIACTSSGCKHDGNSTVTPTNSNNTTGTGTGTVNNNTPAGKWVVSYYFDKKDETPDYAGYTFEFNTDKTITVSKAGVNTAGIWNQGTDDGKQKFTIAINTTDNKLLELNEDWVIEKKTDTEIDLKDDNSEHNEQLHFTKQ